MSSVGNAREVPVEVKAAYLCGMWAGTNDIDSESVNRFRESLRPHAVVAAMVAFGDGAFNPLQVWEMEAFYDRVVDSCEQSAPSRQIPLGRKTK